MVNYNATAVSSKTQTEVMPVWRLNSNHQSKMATGQGKGDYLLMKLDDDGDSLNNGDYAYRISPPSAVKMIVGGQV